MTPAELGRFEAKISYEPNTGCWLWMACVHHTGYAIFSIQSRAKLAHRLSYQHWKGAVPEGLQLDHLCRVRSCVNPDHLEAVTSKVNVHRGEGRAAYNVRKTHCKRGHELSGGNLKGQRTDIRSCRACANSARQHKRQQLRALKANRTACRRGHEYTEENLRIRFRSDGKIERCCRMCERLRYRQDGA